MTARTITLELPPELYRQAQHVAKTTRRSLEDVVLAWLRPPAEEGLADLEQWSDDELRQVARASVAPDHIRRLRHLLAAQRQRTLTECEQQEAAILVEQEDLMTLRKARALFLLKQRGALPEDPRPANP